MKKIIQPSALSGIIDAPASKSLTQRAIVAGLFARGKTTIHNPSFCEDSIAATNMAETLGATIKRAGNSLSVEGSTHGTGEIVLDCGESGLAMRMFAPVAALLSGKVILNGKGSLLNRPATMIVEALSQLGVNVQTSNGLLPLAMTGHLRGGTATINGSAGSQLLTGLLMALPLAETNSIVYVKNLSSKPYIELTLQVLQSFGISIDNENFSIFRIPGRQSYQAGNFIVEGDWSGASFLLAAGAIGGKTGVRRLNPESRQADRNFLEALKKAGADLHIEQDRVTVLKSPLHGFSFDATDSPDLFPPLAALAAYCSGTSVIKGTGRLTHKESNRALTISNVLSSMGISVRLENDNMIITGGRVKGAAVSSHNDHRIAMMAAVLATGATGDVTVSNAEAINKSYPDFYEDMLQLGARII